MSERSLEQSQRRFMRLLEPAPQEAPEVSAHAPLTGSKPSRNDAAEGAERADSTDYGEGTIEMLAAKILIDWLRNRQQLLVPFKLDLQQLEAEQVDTLMQAMIAAAQAEGSPTEGVPPRLEAALQSLNPSAAHQAAFQRACTHPLPMRQVLAQVPDVQSGALVYAASVLATDRRKLVNRQYLRYLAARLHLPRDLARSLEQRYAPAL